MTDEERGALLQRHRKQKGDSIAKASRFCMVGERIWRRWENGQAKLPLTIPKLYLEQEFHPDDWE